jgi:hypothetical protein
MNTAMLLLALAVAPPPAEKEVTAAQKKTFLELLARLPTRGEFFAEEAVNRAAPHTRVLLALTREDVGKRDLYPFLALSRGLLDRKDQREYGSKHFATIAHPTLKLAWGMILFNEKAASPEIAQFLQMALESREQAGLLSQMLGPDFEDFQKRIKVSRLEKD